MADNTPLNSQITDSITQMNVEVIGSSPATAYSMLINVLTSSLGLAAQNAVTNQQNLNSLGSAVITKCVSTLLGSEEKK